MIHEHLRRRAKVLLIGAGALGVITAAAYAVGLATWEHPCSASEDLSCGMGGFICWCDGDFNDPDHWSGLPGGNSIAKVRHSHESVSDEDYLLMAFQNASDDVWELRLASEDVGSLDKLDVRFINKNAGGDTLSIITEVKLDATNGMVTLTAESAASGEDARIQTQ